MTHNSQGKKYKHRLRYMKPDKRMFSFGTSQTNKSKERSIFHGCVIPTSKENISKRH